MKALTGTQKGYAELLRDRGYIIVTEGSSYATYVIHQRQMNSSSFEALRDHNLIECISRYMSPSQLIISVWKYKPKES